MLNKVAYRYAKAIFDSLKEPIKLRALIEELKDFSSLISGHAELSRVLTTASFTEKQRRDVITDLAAKLKLSDDTKKVSIVLSDAKRLDHVPLIIERLVSLILEATQVVPLMVDTATSLESDEKKKVEEKFQKILGKKVEASYNVNPALIGGLKVTAGGRTYDGSLSGWLGHFQESLEIDS